MIGIDMKVRFVPSFRDSTVMTPEERKEATVTGTVVYINYEHKMFMVEFEDNGAVFKESFKFSDCGKTVTVCG